jgi:ankyrin repeat protein
LVECGADIFKENSQGLSCLHIAAQGDQIGPLVFFKEKGVDFCKKDNKGSSPLHWASYIGFFFRIIFLN